MTSLMDRPTTKAKTGGVLRGTLPQVNLLPPEVRAARGLRKTKRLLGLSLILVLVLCVAAYGVALVSQRGASGEVVEAQADTARLQTEEAQYAKVGTVLGALGTAQGAVQAGMSTDVQWRSYVDAITAVLPENVSFDSFTVGVATPMSPPAAATSALAVPSVGQVMFSARASTVPDTAAWVDALNGVPGFADAWVSSVSATSDDKGDYYIVSGIVQVTDKAFSHRFDIPKGEG